MALGSRSRWHGPLCWLCSFVSQGVDTDRRRVLVDMFSGGFTSTVSTTYLRESMSRHLTDVFARCACCCYCKVGFRGQRILSTRCVFAAKPETFISHAGCPVGVDIRTGFNDSESGNWHRTLNAKPYNHLITSHLHLSEVWDLRA